jgi:predicted membrane channel-forming protein YqfA (hemolysin III family)
MLWSRYVALGVPLLDHYWKLMGAPQGFDRKEILHRIGTFFLLVGMGLLVFFMLSEAAKTVTFSYFCWSLILMIVGFLFRGQFKRNAPASGRFSLVRRLMPKAKKEDQGKK